MSSIGKFIYSLVDRDFYESLDAYKIDETTFVATVRTMLTQDWTFTRHGIWMNCLPAGCILPFQGWKIHISCSNKAVDLLRVVVPVLAKERAAFKFAADPNLLFLLTSKQWYRGGAGKFVTVYPQDLVHFLLLIDQLADVTREFEGPYILSDRRYKDSKCVFYRYGGIAPRTTLTVKGDQRPYILSPDNRRVPDNRLAWFTLPEWVQDPFGNSAGPSSRERTLKEGRYVVEFALRFSNSGGLYLASDRETGTRVVIKEARPHIVLDNAGNDSVGMLRKEYRILKKLEAARVAPRPIDFFQQWEHQFLVEEYLEGLTMRQHSVAHNVTRPTKPTTEEMVQFYGVFQDIFARLARVLDILQQHRIVFRDLSPTNVMILRNNDVRILDFEAACELEVDGLCGLFTPGFATADHFNGDGPQFENDYYSLGALMLSYLMPVHAVLTLDPSAHARFAKAITTDFGLPNSLCDTITGLMQQNPAERPNAK
jgi:predicted Ser/Thr protein kinase